MLGISLVRPILDVVSLWPLQGSRCAQLSGDEKGARQHAQRLGAGELCSDLGRSGADFATIPDGVHDREL